MRIGLSLSGGGIRSVVHLGMMQALEEEGVSFDILAGASAGAVGAALYCNGYRPRDILEIIENTNLFKVIKPALNWRGLLKIENAAHELKKYIENDSFAHLKKPLVVSVTNLTKGKVKYFKKGQLIKPLLASCSIPVVFDPVVINGVSYIDGGIIDNLPVKPLKKRCDFIIGMHSNPIIKSPRVSNWKDLMERSLLLAITSGTQHAMGDFDVFWEPPAVGNYKVFDFKKTKEIYNIGYDYAKSRMHKIPLEKLLVTT